MSGPQLLSLPGSFLTPPATLPVAIDYPAALALRQMALVQDELPKYLLAPEISALLHYVPDLHRKMLLATLWNTGSILTKSEINCIKLPLLILLSKSAFAIGLKECKWNLFRILVTTVARISTAAGQ